MKVRDLIHALLEVDTELDVKFWRMDWGYVDIKEVQTSRGFADLLTFSKEELRQHVSREYRDENNPPTLRDTGFDDPPSLR